MFLAIVPVRFQDVIDTVPRMAALCVCLCTLCPDIRLTVSFISPSDANRFYNDCVYIAHNCTLISHWYLKVGYPWQLLNTTAV